MTGMVPKSSIMEEHPMHAIRMMSVATLAFGLLGTAIAPAVHAQGTRTDQAASMIFVDTDGRVMQMPVDSGMNAEAMKSSTALTAPVMITVSGGKAYMTNDAKMSDGKMLYDTFRSHITERAGH
jgi:hypothetical protein